jgi:hypothetical protein
VIYLKNDKIVLLLKYKNDFKNIRQLMNWWDPVGLINSGAPEDEYDDVTEQILLEINKGTKQKDLAVFICSIFENDFNFEISAEDANIFSARLFSWFRGLS